MTSGIDSEAIKQRLQTLLEGGELDGKSAVEQMVLIQTASLSAIAEGTITPGNTSAGQQEKKCVVDKEYIFPEDYPDWDSVYIFKYYGNNYYIREKDLKTNKWLNAESLKVGSNRDKARQKAIQLHIERKSRREKNLLHKSINCTELNRLYLLERKQDIHKRTRIGLSPESYDALINKLTYWTEYVKEKGHSRRSIENIPKEVGERFGVWINDQPKQNRKETERSVSVINAIISATQKMYEWANKKGYISSDVIPNLTKLDRITEKSADEERDTLWEEEWKNLESHILKMSKDKKVSAVNRAKYTQDYWYFKLAYETGMRLKEINNLTWDRVTEPTHETGNSRIINRRIYIDKSKTSRKRTITSPVSYIFNGLEKLYRSRGIQIDRSSKTRVFFKIQTHKCIQDQWNTDKAMVDRLDNHMKTLGLMEKLSKEMPPRRITPNSSRHYFCTYTKVNDDWSWERIALHVGHDAKETETRYSKVTAEMINARKENKTGIDSMDSLDFFASSSEKDVQENERLKKSFTDNIVNNPGRIAGDIKDGNLIFEFLEGSQLKWKDVIEKLESMDISAQEGEGAKE